ncbi:hypothetical protein VAE122_2980230 [Vibrio aestuarianus]|nr:hypothetical protein VAE122_2980230 [Vibrio aestuarianus]
MAKYQPSYLTCLKLWVVYLTQRHSFLIHLQWIKELKPDIHTVNQAFFSIPNYHPRHISFFGVKFAPLQYH